VAATDPARREGAPAEAVAPRRQLGALFAAALALPGVAPAEVRAETAPESGVIAFKVLDYRDWQPGADRMRVRSPSLYVLKPLSSAWVVEGTLVYDAMSGASPLWHNTLSGASGLGVTDYRTAGEVKLARYSERAVVALGAAASSERDYRSRALSLDGRWSEADNNRSWSLGIAGADDRIHSVNGVAANERRRTLDVLVGVTQAWRADAIVALTATWSHGSGYYSDPYKPLDQRPRSRDIFAGLLRYNQYLPAADATLRLAYRYMHDSFGPRSHMVDAEWWQPLADGWSLRPGLRYYTQSAADFYFDPPFPRGYVAGADYSADTRLSAFGALTPGVVVDKRLDGGWSIDLKLEFYRQRSGWRLGGAGSPGLAPFSARWIELGVARTF
jgi:hypothetical protein